MDTAIVDRTSVEGLSLIFRLPDPEHRFTAVRLPGRMRRDLGYPELDFSYDGGGWLLAVPRPWMWRLEYQYEVSTDGEHWETINDPTAPLLAPGPFGAKSWIELPGYAEPAWRSWSRVPGSLSSTTFDTRDGELTVTLWTPDGYGDELPLLLAHDGPELAELAHVLDYSAALIASGALPPHRVALLTPGDRDLRYAANEQYGNALVLDVLPELAAVAPWPASTKPVLAGLSLGALSALHIAWRHTEVFAGLFLQSGSFFTPDTDPQEAGYRNYDQVTAFVAQVLAAANRQPEQSDSLPQAGSPDSVYLPGVVVAMTCGATEENIHNNRVMARALDRLGVPVDLTLQPDLHNFIAWCDALHPGLTRLLTQVWR